MGPISPPGRKFRAALDRETILSLSDGRSVKKDGYGDARMGFRNSPADRKITLK
jgi:hypothetical protein